MLSVRFEPAIPTIKRLQTYALDRTVTGNGLLGTYLGVFAAKRGCVLLYLCFLIPNEPLNPTSIYWSNISLTHFKMKKLNFATQGVYAHMFISE